MFADSLETSWADRSRRGWTTLTSFALQVVVAGLLLLIPILRPEGLPLLRRLTTPISVGQLRSEPAPIQPHPAASSVQSNLMNNRLMQPRYIPPTVARITDDEPPPQAAGPAGPYIPGLDRLGDPNGALGTVGNGTRPVMPAPPPTAHTVPIRVSHMSEGDLVRKVQPVYPQIAVVARIQGEVLLQAIISREGTIKDLRVVKGHPLLVKAAIDAVSQWRYRPYLLNNDPVEVETQITVKFSLDR